MPFHLNYKGEARPCDAKPGNCRFGDNYDHFDTEADARQAYEKAMEAFASSSMKKEPVVKKAPADAHVLKYERLAGLTKGGPTAGELADMDGYDGDIVESRIKFFQKERVKEAEKARAKADANPNSMGDEIEAQRLEKLAGLSEPRRVAKKAAAKKVAAPKKPKIAESWKDGATPEPKDSKVIVPAQINDPTGGYMGGSKWRGGKVPDRYLTQKEAGRLIRADIAEAKKIGELPKDLSYSVRSASGAWVTSIDIYIGAKDANGKATSIHETDEGDSRIIAVKRYLDALGNQYSTDDSNSMVDYFNSHNRARVSFWHKYL